jgi:hypothetical protein
MHPLAKIKLMLIVIITIIVIAFCIIGYEIAHLEHLIFLSSDWTNQTMMSWIIN